MAKPEKLYVSLSPIDRALLRQIRDLLKAKDTDEQVESEFHTGPVRLVEENITRRGPLIL